MSFNIKSDTQGRWVGIFQALGIDVQTDGRHGPCPACGGKDRFRFDDKEGVGSFFCNSCGAGNGWTLVQKCCGVDFKGALAMVKAVAGHVDAKAIPKGRKLLTKDDLRAYFLNADRATKANLAGVYLQSRGLTVVPDTLWIGRKCWESETKKNQLAMVAVVSMPDSEVAGLHLTFLDQDGDKLKINNPKKLTPRCVSCARGSAIRLFPLEGTVLGVAEGIETAIAAHEDAGVPVWAAVNAQGMAAFVPPDGVEMVIFFADNDKSFTGQAAAYTGARRMVVEYKKQAQVLIPAHTGDFLDDLVRRRV